MNFIKRFRTWLVYKRCLMKHDEAIEMLKYCLDGTTTYMIWSGIAICYLNEALDYEEQLDAL